MEQSHKGLVLSAGARRALVFGTSAALGSLDLLLLCHPWGSAAPGWAQSHQPRVNPNYCSSGQNLPPLRSSARRKLAESARHLPPRPGLPLQAAGASKTKPNPKPNPKPPRNPPDPTEQAPPPKSPRPLRRLPPPRPAAPFRRAASGTWWRRGGTHRHRDPRDGRGQFPMEKCWVWVRGTGTWRPERALRGGDGNKTRGPENPHVRRDGESLRSEKTSKVVEANGQANAAAATKRRPRVPRLRAFWSPPGMVTQTWAACSNARQPFWWRSFS